MYYGPGICRDGLFQIAQTEKIMLFLAAHIPDEYKNAELQQTAEFQKSRDFHTNVFKFFGRLVTVIIYLVLFVIGTVGLTIYLGIFVVPT